MARYVPLMKHLLSRPLLRVTVRRDVLSVNVTITTVVRVSVSLSLKNSSGQFGHLTWQVQVLSSSLIIMSTWQSGDWS